MSHMHKDLFIAFFRAGMLGYGGGLSAIPLMQKEVVERYEWMNDDEFADILALANTLPGPINTKMSGYIGWRLKGFSGMLNCVIATVAPTAILIILLLTALNAYKDKPWVQGMSKGVLPIAGVMIGVLAWDFIHKTKLNLGWGLTIFYTILSLIIIQFVGIHPAIVIIALILYALLFKSKSEKEVRRTQEDES